MEPFLCGLVLALFLLEINGAPTYSRETTVPGDTAKGNITRADDHRDVPLEVTAINNIVISTDDADDDYGDVVDPIEEDYYYYYDYYDSFGICTNKSSVIIASDVVGVFSSNSARSSDDPGWDHWTIVPKHFGGSVTIAKRDHAISQNIFRGGCEDVHMFQSWRNHTISRVDWCHEKRLLPCDAMMQISYHMLGYQPTTDPGKGVDIVQLPSPTTYDYTENDDDDRGFSLYYYECGGIRYRGDIRSPLFPDEKDPYRGSVTCKWDLRVSQTADFGVLRFSGFNLPSCDNHYLTIEEDTMIDEKDVTESLLRLLGEQMKLNVSNILDHSDEVQASNANSLTNDTSEENFEVTVSEGEDKMKSLYFYRDGSISESEVQRNPRIGIHAVVFKKYCGDFKPKRTITWRRGSKNVSFSFFSDNYTLRDYGFTAKFSTFSFLHSMNRHWSENGDKPGQEVKPDVPHMIFNYIILIIFVPIGLTVGLSVIIFHIKRRGPTLKDFYRRDRKGGRFRRASSDRAKPASLRIRGPARRVRSLEIFNKSSKHERDSGRQNEESQRRKNFFIGRKISNDKKKRLSPLKTLVEEDSSSSIKLN